MPLGVAALGLLHGAISGLLALGLVLTYRTHRVLNLAHASVGMLSGVVVGLLVTAAGWQFWLAAPVGVLTGAAVGVAVERLVVARLDAAPRVVVLVATLGVAQVLGAAQTALPLALTGHVLPPYDVPFPVGFDLFPVRFAGGHVVTLLACPVAVAALAWFLRRTRAGLGVRALACDPQRARQLGVRADLVSPVAWAVAGALAAVGGMLAVPVLGFSLSGTPSATVLLLALAPAVLGGLRSLPRTFAAALVLGVVYQACLWYTDRAAVADLLLVGVVLVALALRRAPLGRAADAVRASAWPALPPAAARRTGPPAAVLAVAAVLAPVVLSPSAAQRWAATCALAVTAASVAFAWSYAGQLALGQWGVAALGALVLDVGVARAGAVDGVVLAAAAGALACAALALTAREDGPLGGATASLAVAAGAPLVTTLLRGSAGAPLDAPPARLVAVVTAATLVAVLAASARLRRSRGGRALVAGAEDAAHARALGLRVAAGRVVALSLAGAAAGVGGALYALAQRGPAPDAFAGDRSLAVVAMAAVGGLGSPARAAAGVFAVVGAQALLPGSWQLLGSGAGVLAVTLTRPTGLVDALAALVAVLRQPVRAVPTRVTSWAATTVAVVGSDTRAARALVVVRRAQLAAVLLGGLVYAAGAALAGALGSGEWAVVATLALVLAGVRAGAPGRLPLAAAGVVTAAAAAFVLPPAVAALAGTLAAGVALGGACRTAAWSAPEPVRAAATGLVTTGALAGLPVGLHVAAVAAGGGARAAAGWVTAYAVAAALACHAVRTAPPAPEAPTAPARQGAALSARSLRAGHGGHDAVRDADLDVEPGELVLVVGGNGAGKSTLLAALAGSLAHGGDVAVSGREVTGLAVEDRRSAGLAFVDGARPVLDDLTVAEHLRLAAARHRSRRAHAAATAAVLEVLPELRPALDRPAATLSGGERRLLAVAALLVDPPVVVLADEVTLGLAPDARDRVLHLLRRLADAGAAVVLVDHAVAAAVRYADRVLAVDDGRVVAAQADDLSRFTAARHLGTAATLAGAVR